MRRGSRRPAQRSFTFDDPSGDARALLSLTIRSQKHTEFGAFPLSVPAIRALVDAEPLDMDADVVCFVGENGSGKSTLLEALAVAVNLPAAGATSTIRTDTSLQAQSGLADLLHYASGRRTRRGFFLRSEDFINFGRSLERDRAEMTAELARMAVEYADASEHARTLAMGPLRNSLYEMTHRYGADADARSHGEQFLNFFQQRVVPEGLYMLDEPEAALSPQRQLALLAIMMESVAQGSQFVMATHSPILLGYPGARIYSFDEAPPTVVPWDSLDHVRLTREFLADPERYLRGLR
jgi:predicted ATPase